MRLRVASSWPAGVFIEPPYGLAFGGRRDSQPAALRDFMLGVARVYQASRSVLFQVSGRAAGPLAGVLSASVRRRQARPGDAAAVRSILNNRQPTEGEESTVSGEMLVGVAGEPMRPRSNSPFQPWLRLLLGVLGGAAFAGGVAAVFVTANGTGTGMLITFGGILLVLALLGDRIESFEFGGSKLKMRAAAAEKFALAEDSEDRGDTATAARLRAEAQVLLGAAASEYRTVRGSMPEGLERTRALERIMDNARTQAAKEEFQADDVIGWLRDGSDEERITALAIMQAKPSLRDFDAALAAIKDPRSAFEMYHAMKLAKQMLGDLNVEQKQRLSEILKDEKSLRFPYDRGRRRLSEEILDSLGMSPLNT